jgi:two-component system response regulator FlrC
MEALHPSQKILIVDDEQDIRNGLQQSLNQMGFEVIAAESGERALYEMNRSSDIGFVLTDYRMPGLDGFDVLKEAKKLAPNMPVVIMTGHGSVNHAVDAMHKGADDYLCKPFRLEELEKIIVKGLPEEQRVETAVIISEDLRFQDLLKKAKRAAQSSAPILVEGPSGAGKELLARQIHEWSPRSKKPWVAVNCAALPSGLLESELFGFEKGSFTGANEKRSGKFEQADTGTLLLDEIGELEPLLQAKLLRVLQEGEIDRIGGRQPQKVDVRIIATTNKNLRELVQQGRFREDLYFRLYGVRFDMPSLAERQEDIPLLAKTFLQRQESVQHRKLSFSEGVLDYLKSLDWPGNVRELEHSVERASILSETGVIDIENFEFSQPMKKPVVKSFEQPTRDLEKKTIREMERDIILKALEAHAGNRTHTAKALGMSLRTLRHKLKQYRDEGVCVEPARQFSVGKKDLVSNFDAGLGTLKP